jgi:hypothetical protein
VSPPSNIPKSIPASERNAPTTGRPWLGIQFVCANQYRRVFRDVNGQGYLARCPSCGSCVRFRVGQGGSNERFFELDCR